VGEISRHVPLSFELFGREAAGWCQLLGNVDSICGSRKYLGSAAGISCNPRANEEAPERKIPQVISFASYMPITF